MTNSIGVERLTHFDILVGDMGCNVILERPSMHPMKVVSSTYHWVTIFPTLKGLKKIIGDLEALMEIYNIIPGREYL